jgi:hypothetical protein
MSDELNEASGFSRRSMIKRSAIVGGTLVWAQPVVQGFGTAAGASHDGGSPLTGFSYIAVVYNCGAGNVRAKYELDEGGWEVNPGSTPDCDPAGWDGTPNATNPGSDIHVEQDGDEITFTLLCEGGTFTSGVIKQGSSTSSENPCASGQASGNTITFNTGAVGPD